MAAKHDGWKKVRGGKLQHERLVELADGGRTVDQITSIINKEYKDKKHVDSVRRKCERMGLPFAPKKTSRSGSKWDIEKNGKTEGEFLNGLATGDKTLEDIQGALEFEFGGLRPRRSINSIRKKVEQIRKGAYVHENRIIPPATTDEGTTRLQIEYDRKIDRLTNELAKVRGLYREAVRKDTVVERIVEDIQTVVKALPPTSFPNIVHPYDTKKVKLTTEEVHLLLSDCHVGEVVAADEVLGLNEYNFEIFKSRLKHLENTVLDLCFSKMLGYRFPKLNVSMLGDFLTGTIHDELVETSDINIVDALVGSVWVFAQFFQNLLQTFDSIEVRCVVGNHGRLHKKPRYKQPYINWDYLFYYMLDMLFAADDRITFQIPRSFFLLDEIGKQTWLLLHGDNVQMWNQIAWYGINRMVSRFQELMASQGQYIKYVAMGHFHNMSTLQSVVGRKIINGNFCGSTEFSIKKMQGGSEPVQLLHGLHPDKGISWEFQINLQRAEKSLADAYQYTKEYDAARQFAQCLTQ